MANLTIKSNTYTPIALRDQQSRVNYNGAQIVDQSGYYGKMGKAAGVALKAIQDKEESDETERILNANNEFAKRVADIKLGIETNMQGSNAKNAAALYEQQVEAARKDVYANSGLKYKAGENMFNRNAFATISRGGLWAKEWEKTQTDKAKATTYDLAVDDYTNSILGGTATFDEGYAYSIHALDGLFPNMPKEQRTTMIKATADKMGGTLVAQAIDRNDYESANRVFDYFSPDMTSAMRAKLSSAIYQNQEYTENSDMAKALEASGITDPDEQRQWLISNYGGENGVVKVAFKDGVSFDGVQPQAVAGTEGVVRLLNDNGIDDVYITSTAHDYSGHAPGSAHYEGVGVDLASDKLDSMGANGRAAFKTQIEKQFPGVKVLNEYDDPSDYSTSGHFHIDFSGYKGNGRIGMSEMRLDKIIGRANQLRTQRLAREKAADDIEAERANSIIYGMFVKGSGFDEVQDFIMKNVGGNAKLGKKLMTYAKFYYGDAATNPGGKAAPAYNVSLFKSKLASGEFKNQDDVREAAEILKFNGNQKNKALEEYTKFQKGEGDYKYDFNGAIKTQVLGSKPTDAAKVNYEGAKIASMEWISSYKQKNGHEPTTVEVVDNIIKNMGKTISVTVEKEGWIFDGEERQEYTVGQMMLSGIRSIVPNQNGYYAVTYNDGRTVALSAEALAKNVLPLEAPGKHVDYDN